MFISAERCTTDKSLPFGNAHHRYHRNKTHIYIYTRTAPVLANCGGGVKKIRKIFGQVATYYAAIQLQLRNPNPIMAEKTVVGIKTGQDEKRDGAEHSTPGKDIG